MTDSDHQQLPAQRLDAVNPWGKRRFGFWPLVLVLTMLAFAAGWLVADGNWRTVTHTIASSGATLRDHMPGLSEHWSDAWTKSPEQPVRPQPKGTTSAPSATRRQTTTAQSRPIDQWCRALAGRLFSVSLRQCLGRDFQLTGHHSVDGRPIAVRTVAASQQPAIGRVLVIGGTHGDELTSVSLTFWWLDMLEDEESPIDWRVAPAMNPDGVLQHPPRRLNAHGVDLNRNLPTPGWHQASQEYWRDVDREPRRYPGERAASEPETQWLVSEIEHHRPDVIVSLHAPYGILDYDGEYPPPKHLGSLSLQRLGVFPGSLGNYGSRHLGIPVITVELQDADQMPSRAQARKMWHDLNHWLQRYLGAQRQAAADADVDS